MIIKQIICQRTHSQGMKILIINIFQKLLTQVPRILITKISFTMKLKRIIMMLVMTKLILDQTLI